MTTPLLRAAAERDRLKSWLLEDAYPLWWARGADHEGGGFWEKLDQEGTPVDLPRRGRVLPRQIYAFAVAPDLGWQGPAAQVVAEGVDWYLAHFRRPDGLFRTLVARDGTVLDDSTALYDQAFGMFCLAAASRITGRADLHDIALATLQTLRRTRSHPIAGFVEAVPDAQPHGANPHMHMFEACLAWEETGAAAEWSLVADSIAELALSRFIDAGSGILREFFDDKWTPMAGKDGRIVEPGHQFEWGWLLLRWGLSRHRPDATEAALRLIVNAEEKGVDRDRKVAINALLDDFSVHDPVARLWPQTERIKAACMGASVTGDARYWDMVARGAQGLQAYLQTKVRGLWWDRLQADGSFVAEAAPASSFYHIVCAIQVFDEAVTKALADGATIPADPVTP